MSTNRMGLDAENLRKQLAVLSEVALVAYWELDIVNQMFIFDDQVFNLFKTSSEKIGGYEISVEDYARIFVHPDDAAFFNSIGTEILETGDYLSLNNIEHRIVYGDGNVGHIRVRVFLVRNENNIPTRAYGVMQDITEEKENLLFLESLDKVNQAIRSDNDLECTMGSVLKAVLSIFECDRTYLAYPCDPDAPAWSIKREIVRPGIKRPPALNYEIPMCREVSDDMRIVLDTTGAVLFCPESEHRIADNVSREYDLLSQMSIALRPKAGKPWLFAINQKSHARIWTLREKKLFEQIAERLADSLTSLLMYRDLKENEKFLKSIVDNIPDAIFVRDAKTLKLTSLNKAGEIFSGVPRQKQFAGMDLFPEELADAFLSHDKEIFASKQPVEVPEETFTLQNGKKMVVRTKKIPILDEAGEPQYLLGISEDISETRKLQEKLNHALRMETIGRLSSGIAHDFNNILQPMIGYCELLRGEFPADVPQQKFIESIYNSGLRAKDLISRILTFSRQTEKKSISISIQKLLTETMKLLRPTIPSNIEIVQNIQGNCGDIMADPTQLHQVFMNLMINAFHATEQSGGVITVGLKETVLTEADYGIAPLKPGRYAELSFSDTGHGIKASDLPKIFDPYFSTKTEDKGTGLGLSVVYGIVKDHGGYINAYSEGGEGTTFKIYLPLAQKSSKSDGIIDNQLESSAGNEHILLVDDEKSIVQLYKTLFERMGYKVTCSNSGLDALEEFRSNPGGFDLVITDLTMPGMTGIQLAKELASIDPEIPVVLCTGFNDRIPKADAKLLGIKEFIEKPVTFSELSRKVRNALNSG